PPTKETDELKAADRADGRSDTAVAAASADALNVTSRCSSSVTSAKPLLLDTGAFGALLACGFDEEIRIYKLSDARRAQRGGQEPNATASAAGFLWRWPRWQRLAGVHRAAVRDIQASPNSEVQLVSCGMDGRLAVWNYPTGQAVSVIELGCPILRVLPLLSADLSDADNDAPAYYCLLPSNRQGKQEYRVTALNSQALKQNKPGMKLMGRVLPDCLSLGQNGRFLVSANRGNLLVYRPSRQRVYSHFACDGARCRVVSVAAHPSQRSAAVGLSNGRILIMHGLFTSGRPVSTLLQWHFRPVSGLTYASDGCALYSGGEEAVLVKWDTSPEAGEATGNRAFLPRLGARIVGAVCGPTGQAAAAAVLSDNSVLVLDSNMGLVGGLNGGVLVGADDDGAPDEQQQQQQLGLLRDPLTECVAMPGQAGVVQFYSVSEQRHLGCLDVAKANYTAVESAVVSKVTPARVEAAAFSDAGAWLATFDRRDDGRYPPELRLRLWLRQCHRPLVKSEVGDVNGETDALFERLAFSQCSEERLAHCIVGMAFQPCAGERKLVCSLSDGSLVCWTRQERVRHLAEPGRHTDFASFWTITRTWRLGHSFTGGPLAFDPTGRYLLTCHQSQACAAVWSTCNLARPPALFRLFDGAAQTAGSQLLAFCSMWDSGQSVVVCGRDRLRVWDQQSGRRLAEARLTVTSAAEDHKSGMLILLCAAEQALLMLHSCEPGQLSRIRLNCPSEPVNLCVTEDTFVFMTRDRRLFVYPEPAAAAVAASVENEATTAAAATKAELEAESAAAASLLGRVFGRRQAGLLGGAQLADPGAALEARLRLFTESDAFAAPSLARFVAGNLELVRRRLLAEDGLTGEGEEQAEQLGDGFAGWGGFGKSGKKSNDDAESEEDDVELSAPTMKNGDAAEPELSEAVFDRVLCHCLAKFSSSGSRLPSLRQVQRRRRQNRRRLRRAAEKIAVAAAAVSKPAVPAEPIAQPDDADELNQSQQNIDTADTESDLIVVSATMATPRAGGNGSEDEDDDEEDDASVQRHRPAKRHANGELAVDLDEESSCSGRSSVNKRSRRRKIAA
uniref:WD_REPEATS_REGION domain-containing protein n=1 Tax=Macrostomum lignano TaxID=282301 RepID=A0A1I8HSQ3_9PLAT